jgi:hypothetical protein
VVYAGRRDIQAVEVSSDGGMTWSSAELLDQAAPGQDQWVRWQSQFSIASGQSLTQLARATDGTGEVQMQAFSLPQPDGGTGWPSLEVLGSWVARASGQVGRVACIPRRWWC